MFQANDGEFIRTFHVSGLGQKNLSHAQTSLMKCIWSRFQEMVNLSIPNQLKKEDSLGHLRISEL